MAKTIKFNLILDNHPVRDIEGLREKFSIEDMLEYFNSGLLLRWLDIRGYEKESDAVKAINKSADKKEIITALVKIFEVDEIYEEDIERTINILEYMESKRKENELYRENSFERERVILDYHNGYQSVIEKMEANKEDFAFLKNQAKILFMGYFRLFEMDYRNLYFRLTDSALKAIFAIITIDDFRKIWLESELVMKDMRSRLLDESAIKKYLKDDVKRVCKNTSGEWETIESLSKEVVVLWCGYSNQYRSAEDRKNSFGSYQNGTLHKIKGLEYKCSNSYSALYYLEV